MRRRLFHVLVLAAVLAVPAVASADDTIAKIARDAPVAGYGTLLAYVDDGDVQLQRDGQAPRPSKANATPDALDVGPDRRGAPTVVYAQGRTVFVLRAGGSARRLITLPRGGSLPALDRDRLAYVRREGRCDVPYVLDLRSRRTRRLDRGHCGTAFALDAANGRVATAVTLTDGRTTEARVVPATGGRSRIIQRESQGEESNAIGGLALDGDRLVTTRVGIRQENLLTRFDLRARRRVDARAFLDLLGPVAATRRRIAYVVDPGGLDDDDCGTDGCPLATTTDPWTAAERLLPPQLTTTVGGDLYVDTDAQVTGRLFRKRVSRTQELGREGVAGQVVTLLQDGAPTRFTATTAADGTYTATIPAAEQPPVVKLGARSDLAQTPREDATYLPVFARIVLRAERQADGSVVFSGTVTPKLPGRKVRIDRQEPRGTFTQDPVTSGPLGADGGTFTVTAASAPAGATFRASLDFVRDDPNARRGRSAEVQVP